MKRPTELINKINHCNGEFQDLHDYIIFLENLTKTQRADTIREFAEWLVKNMFNGCDKFWKGDTPNDKPLCMKDFIAEYEKEYKK